jgi:hypothetical protein
MQPEGVEEQEEEDAESNNQPYQRGIPSDNIGGGYYQDYGPQEYIDANHLPGGHRYFSPLTSNRMKQTFEASLKSPYSNRNQI